MKQKTVFCCSECGNETVKWSGRCLACGAWDSLVEVKADVRGKGSAKNAARSAVIKKPKLISELDTEAEMRFSTGIGEFDRVLGGGAVRFDRSRSENTLRNRRRKRAPAQNARSKTRRR